MARKPDVFERMVLAEQRRQGAMLEPVDMVTLLRRYHARVRRIVKNSIDGYGSNEIAHLYRSELLHKLDRLKKGTR
jgi:phage portal protein BeeE